MKDEVRIALIGLDTSHAIEFPRRMQAPDCPPTARVEGLRAVACLRFPTPFADEAVLSGRQSQLEAWGVKVTEDFNEAVADCDAIMLEINDPSLHWEYFRRCAGLNKPVFIDKPLADSRQNGLKIYQLAKERGVKVVSSSSLRYSKQLLQACAEVPSPDYAYCYGPLGDPPVGSGIIWYGIHCFEMLQRAMGPGAVSVDARRDGAGAVIVVEYANQRRGIVELTSGAYSYGGTLRDRNHIASYVVDSGRIYTEQLTDLRTFFLSGETAAASIDDALQIMILLDAAARSYMEQKLVIL